MRRQLYALEDECARAPVCACARARVRVCVNVRACVCVSVRAGVCVRAQWGHHGDRADVPLASSVLVLVQYLPSLIHTCHAIRRSEAQPHCEPTTASLGYHLRYTPLATFRTQPYLGLIPSKSGSHAAVTKPSAFRRRRQRLRGSERAPLLKVPTPPIAVTYGATLNRLRGPEQAAS